MPLQHLFDDIRHVTFASKGCKRDDRERERSVSQKTPLKTQKIELLVPISALGGKEHLFYIAKL